MKQQNVKKYCAPPAKKYICKIKDCIESMSDYMPIYKYALSILAADKKLYYYLVLNCTQLDKQNKIKYNS